MCNRNNCNHRIGYHEEYYKKYKERMKSDPDFAFRQRAIKQRYYDKNKNNPEYMNKHKEFARRSFKKKREEPNFISCHQRKKAESYKILGDKCVKCGFSDKRALQIDHIFNNGNNEIRVLGGTYAIYKKIISMGDEAKTEYQILCANCNWIKREPKHCINNKRYIKCLTN